METPSLARDVAFDMGRLVFAAILCLIVPFASVFSLLAVGWIGLAVGAMPLGGALWLLATARWPVGARIAVSVVAAASTIAYSAVVISGVFAAWST